MTARDRIHAACWASFTAAKWAQQFGLPPGNRWEPTIIHNMENESRVLGDDANARQIVIRKYERQLGVETV